MKKTTILAAVLCLASSAACASDYYVSGSLGAAKGKIGHATTVGLQKPKNSTAFTGEIAIGSYLAPSVRTELALGYAQQKAKVKSTASVTVANIKAVSLGLMLNGYYDINVSEVVTPYVMAGIGYARTKYSAADSNDSKISGHKGDLAWQVGAGVDFNLAESTKLGLGYRFRSGTSKMKKGDLENLEIRRKPSHALLASVRFDF